MSDHLVFNFLPRCLYNGAVQKVEFPDLMLFLPSLFQITEQLLH